MTILEDVAEAARKRRAAVAEAALALEELRRQVLRARAEQISYSAIARAAQLSHQRIRQMVEEE